MADENNQAAEEARRANEARRNASAEFAKKSAERVRQQSEETLDEQSNMKPVPSQEEADLIKVGARTRENAEDVEQPEGPAQRAAQAQEEANQEAMQANNPAGYATRDMAASDAPVRRGPGRPRKAE